MCQEEVTESSKVTTRLRESPWELRREVLRKILLGIFYQHSSCQNRQKRTNVWLKRVTVSPTETSLNAVQPLKRFFSLKTFSLCLFLTVLTRCDINIIKIPVISLKKVGYFKIQNLLYYPSARPLADVKPHIYPLSLSDLLLQYTSEARPSPPSPSSHWQLNTWITGASKTAIWCVRNCVCVCALFFLLKPYKHLWSVIKECLCCARGDEPGSPSSTQRAPSV